MLQHSSSPFLSIFCMHVPPFVYPFYKLLDIWVVSFLAIMNNVAVNIHVHVLAQLCVFISLEYLGVEFLGHMVTLTF